MSLSDLDVARAQYLWALHRHKPLLDDQIRDLAMVFGRLMQAETERKAVTTPQPAQAPLLRVMRTEAA